MFVLFAVNANAVHVKVLCGRAYDPAIFAAEPVRRGFPAATALHAAKVLECGAIATTPGSGSAPWQKSLECDDYDEINFQIFPRKLEALQNSNRIIACTEH